MSGTPSTRFSGSWTCTVPQCEPRPREAIASCMCVQVLARPSVKWLACRPKVNAAFTFGRHASHFTDGLANTCTHMQLAIASLGLGPHWGTVHVRGALKRVRAIGTA